MRRFMDRLTETVVALAIIGTGLVTGFAAGKVAVAVLADVHNVELEAQPLVPPVIEGVPVPPVVPVAPEPAPAAEPDEPEWQKRVRQDRVLVYAGGLFLEALANATPDYLPWDAFQKQFLKQFGVQIQISVMHDAGLISRNPAVAFAQGFLVGL